MSSPVMNFASSTKPIINNIRRTVIQSGVLRHGLNANYYAHHNRPGMAIREGAAAAWDAISGSRK
jgi:hypothetical protein